jgi:hypothetical protein
MSSQRLKNTLSFTNLAPGASVVLPHGLRTSRPRPLAPDIIFIPTPDLEVLTDAFEVTLTNVGGDTLSGAILVEAWHTIERTFDGVQNENLTVKPYIVVSVEQGNQPPQPPFELTTKTIYARLTGSDTTGDGRSIATAYRTFQRAIRDVPSIPPPGARYIVDITGIGTEALPDFYVLPTVIFPTIDYQNDATFPYFYSGAGLRIRALPQLASTISAADAVINAGAGATITKDPDTRLITLSIPTQRTSWTTANLKNKHLIRTIGAHQADCVIVAATNAPGLSTLLLTQKADSFNGVIQGNGGPAVGPVFFQPGAVLQIVEQSAILEGGAAPKIDFPNEFAFAGIISTCNSIAFQGLGFTNRAGEVALGLLNCPNTPIELCNVAGISGQGPTGTYWLYANGSVFSYGVVAVNCSFFSSACHFDGDAAGFFFFYIANATPQSFAEAIMSNCGPFTPGEQNGLPIVCNVVFQNVLMQGGAAGAGVLVRGGRAVLESVKINNALGNAVDVLEGGIAKFTEVTGTGNAGFGAFIDDGSHLQVDALTTVGNDTAQAYSNGGVPVAAWPGAPFNDTNLTTLSRVWEP